MRVHLDAVKREKGWRVRDGGRLAHEGPNPRYDDVACFSSVTSTSRNYDLLPFFLPVPRMLTGGKTRTHNQTRKQTVMMN